LAPTAASRLEVAARRERQWLTRATKDRQVLGIHTASSPDQVAELVVLLTAAVADRGRLHVVVLSDLDPDHGPHAGAQTKDTA
jgi:hypothetical protein